MLPLTFNIKLPSSPAVLALTIGLTECMAVLAGFEEGSIFYRREISERVQVRICVLPAEWKKLSGPLFASTKVAFMKHHANC